MAQGLCDIRPMGTDFPVPLLLVGYQVKH